MDCVHFPVHRVGQCPPLLAGKSTELWVKRRKSERFRICPLVTTLIAFCVPWVVTIGKIPYGFKAFDRGRGWIFVGYWYWLSAPGCGIVLR